MGGDGERAGLLERLGLHRPELRAWAAYDWANSAFYTLIVTAIFPVFFEKVPGAALDPEQAARHLALATIVGAAIIALCAPVLGAISDFAGLKKPMLAGFTLLGVVATSLMYTIGEGDLILASTLFVCSSVGAAGAVICYDSLLPHIASEGELDRVSTAGYAIGYVGGGLLLTICAFWIKSPELIGLDPEKAGSLPTRLSFLAVAMWWAVFTVPLLLRVPEPSVPAERAQVRGLQVVAMAFRRVRGTFRELRGYRQAFLALLAVLVYGEGIGTIIKLGAVFAATTVGVPTESILMALILTQFVGIPCAFAFGALAKKIGTRPSITITLIVYIAVCVFAFYMQTATHFTIMAIAVGTVQGGAQALGRSLFASVIPAHKSAEFFGFFALGSKFAGVFGPMLFVWIGELADDNRIGIVSVTGFFVLGALILWSVDLEQGRRVAREADRDARSAEEPSLSG